MDVQTLASLIWLLLIDLLNSRLTVTTTKSVRLWFSAEMDASCLDLVEERTVHSHNPKHTHCPPPIPSLPLYKFMPTRTNSAETHRLTTPHQFEISSATEPGNEAFYGASAEKQRSMRAANRRINMEIAPAGVGRDLSSATQTLLRIRNCCPQ